MAEVRMASIRRGFGQAGFGQAGFGQAMVLACALLATSTAAAWAASSDPGSGGTWGTASQVPGTATSSTAGVESVSCPSPGNCVAGGYYKVQAMVVTEKAGQWGKATAVPGIAALGNGFSQVTSVSCASAGNCAADGTFTNSDRGNGLFVVSEVGGRWGRALLVPGTPADGFGYPMMSSISCPSPGNCSAGGSYHTAHSYQAFVVSQTSGRWGRAVHLAGAGIRLSYYAQVNSVSCPAPGNCTATGVDIPHHVYQLFAASEQNGVWGAAVTIPLSAGISAVNAGLDVNTMSCSAPGNCVAGGDYQYLLQKSGQDTVYFQAFVVSETNGQWSPAIEVPGLTVPAQGGSGETYSVSCTATGTCTAGGYYTSSSGRRQAFVISETGGTWGTAQAVPGLARLNSAGFAEVTSVSCPAVGDCVAGGYYTNRVGQQGFVVGQTSGSWGKAQPVPGLAALNVGRAATVTALSCPSVGHCVGVGDYAGDHGIGRAFTTTES
jgi:hypothetical protein